MLFSILTKLQIVFLSGKTAVRLQRAILFRINEYWHRVKN